jgi:hypothetical protein
MGSQLVSGVVTVLTAIIGVAIVATLVSKNAQTGTVLTSAGTAFSGALGTALSPVSGSSGLGNLGGFPGGGGSSIENF